MKNGFGLFAKKSFRPEEAVGCYGDNPTNVICNNSHDPNAYMMRNLADGLIYLVSSKTIKPGEEITIQYQKVMPIPELCFCGAYNCSGFIGVHK
jgi:SET domain-containing protein